LGVVLTSRPVFHLAVFGAFLLLHHLKEMSVSGNTTTILWRAVSSSGGTYGVKGINIQRKDLFDEDDVSPVIPEIIGIVYLFGAILQHLFQRYFLGIYQVAEAVMLCFLIEDPDPEFLHLKFI